MHVTKRQNQYYFHSASLKHSSPKAAPGPATATVQGWLPQDHHCVRTMQHLRDTWNKKVIPAPPLIPLEQSPVLEPLTGATRLKPSTRGSRNAEQPLGDTPRALAALGQTEVASTGHCFNRRNSSVLAGLQSKPILYICKSEPVHPC